jgi:hypothetical protein
MLAKLITGGHNVWLADEFCASLDVVTAIVVADRLQKVARALGAALIVASSQPEVFASALRPDKVLQLTTAWEYSLIAGADFVKSIPPQRASFPAPTLRVRLSQLKSIRAGKTTTLRIPRYLNVREGLVWLVAKRDMELVKVTGSSQPDRGKRQLKTLVQCACSTGPSPTPNEPQTSRVTGSTKKSIWLQRLHLTGRIAARNGHVVGSN